MKNIAPSKRRQSREIALQVLFQIEFLGPEKAEDCASLYEGKYQASKDVWNYTKHLIHGVVENKEALDSQIQDQSANWTLSRMALVDLLILRICLFEVRYSSDPVPPPAAMNEAIEISKKYGTTDSASFVNGVLDKLINQEEVRSIPNRENK